MKKNGFTLTELLTAVVILVILIGIAIPVYFNISKSAKENEYNSKKSYYTSLAISYAEDNNISSLTKISVSRLVASGYTNVEEYREYNGYEIPFISNPLDSEDNLACHIIEINVDNYEYSADMGDESNCSFAVDESVDSNIVIEAYEYENNKVGNKLRLINGEFEWTRKDVLVLVNHRYPEEKVKSMSVGVSGTNKEIDLNNRLKSVSTNQVKDVSGYTNAVIVNASVIGKQEINAAVELEDGLKISKVTVKIDKENPTIDTQKFSGWTSSAKGILAYVSDGSGSGPKGVYITLNDNPSEINSSNYFAITNSNLGSVAVSHIYINGVKHGLENRSYYLWPVDNVDNRPLHGTRIQISNVDDDAPQITNFTIASSKAYNSIDVVGTIVASDVGAGVVEVCLTNTNNVNTCSWQAYGTNSKTINYRVPGYSEGSGQSFVLYAFAKDAVNNVSAAKISNTYQLYTKCSQTTTTTNNDPSIARATYVADGTYPIQTCTYSYTATYEVTSSKNAKKTTDTINLPRVTSTYNATETEETSCWTEHGSECCDWIWDGGCNATNGDCAPAQECIGHWDCPQEEKCSKQTVYKCPDGGTLDGKKCKKTTNKCPKGYTKNDAGTKCTKTTYSCPDGGVLNDDKCETYSYTCPSGYTSDGAGHCYYTYSCCPYGGSNKTTYCENYHYECRDGGQLFGSYYCIKDTTTGNCSSSCTAKITGDAYFECEEKARDDIEKHKDVYGIGSNYDSYDQYEYMNQNVKFDVVSTSNDNHFKFICANKKFKYVEDQETGKKGCAIEIESKTSNNNSNNNNSNSHNDNYNDYNNYGNSSSNDKCSGWEKEMGLCTGSNNNNNNNQQQENKKSYYFSDLWKYDASTHKCGFDPCEGKRGLDNLSCAKASCTQARDKYLD